MLAAGTPVAASTRRFASSNTSRLIPTLSTTTNTSRLVPSSSARQRAWSSSWICVAGGITKLPTMPAPSGGVMLLVAAPARKTRAAGAAVWAPWIAVSAVVAAITKKSTGINLG